MKVGFIRPTTAFMPEVDAYVKALEADGIQTVVVSPEFTRDLPGEVDLVYRFGGLLRPIPGSSTPEIHEYASASVGRLPRTKNLIKARIATDPVGRVFLNTFVKGEFRFRHEKPFIYRDMGVPDEFFGCARHGTGEFDLVYVGALSGRRGFIEQVDRLSHLGLSILIAGRAQPHEVDALGRLPGITYVGQVPQSDVPSYLSRARAGLNYLPDEYPFSYQTSTKVLEYLVAGLVLVTTVTPWLLSHSKEHRYTYTDVSTIRSREQFLARVSPVNHHESLKFHWSHVLAVAGFTRFVRTSLA